MRRAGEIEPPATFWASRELMTFSLGRGVRLGSRVALGMALAWSSVSFAAQPPNIVFILTDDLDAAAASKMLQVKSLITDQGASFQRHYVNVSLCCPSRVSTLRGQFAHNSGIIINDPPDGGFQGTYVKGIEGST